MKISYYLFLEQKSIVKYKGHLSLKGYVKYQVTSFLVSARCHMSRLFAYAKTKTQISFAVTAKLISAFVIAARIVKSLYFLNPKFQASAIFCCCTAWFVSDLVGNPKDRFSHVAAHITHTFTFIRTKFDLREKIHEDLFTVKFLNFGTPEIFAVIFLKPNLILYFVKMVQME